MGFFKWLDKYLRESNEHSFNSLHESYEWQQEQTRKKLSEYEKVKREQDRLAAIEACANCRWYNSILHRCFEQDVYYHDPDESYKYVCSKFSKK